MDKKLVKENIDIIEKCVIDLNLEFSCYEMKKISKKYTNAFEIDNDLIYFYPPNSGISTCPFEFYKGGKIIIDNRYAYSEISNLDDVILKMVRVFKYALLNEIVLDPYRFMLKLNEKSNPYHIVADLVITDKSILNERLNSENYLEAKMYFINRFLDHFIGWNFGLSVNRNSELKEELEELNSLVIDMGLRKDAGPGYEVYGVIDQVYKGLQHYQLPTEKVKKKELL